MDGHWRRCSFQVFEMEVSRQSMEQETQLIRGVNLVVSSDDIHTLCLLIAMFELHQRNRAKVDMARLWYVSKLIS